MPNEINFDLDRQEILNKIRELFRELDKMENAQQYLRDKTVSIAKEASVSAHRNGARPQLENEETERPPKPAKRAHADYDQVREHAKRFLASHPNSTALDISKFLRAIGVLPKSLLFPVAVVNKVLRQDRGRSFRAYKPKAGGPREYFQWSLVAEKEKRPPAPKVQRQGRRPMVPPGEQLTDKIADVVRQNPDGITVADTASILVAAGHVFSGKNPPNQHVNWATRSLVRAHMIVRSRTTHEGKSGNVVSMVLLKPGPKMISQS